MPNCYLIQAFVGDNMKQWRGYGGSWGFSTFQNIWALSFLAIINTKLGSTMTARNKLNIALY